MDFVSFIMDTFTPKKSAWNVKKRDRNRADELASALSLNPITALLLLQRGIRSPEAAQAFFSPSLKNLHDLFLFDEMERAVSRILVAVEKREKVVIYGDYDLDGITGTAVYAELFKELGHPVEFYIPHRLGEGYGLHAASLRALRSAGAGLIITSDCGSTSHAEISEANRLGLEVIVTDHHLPSTEPLPAAAIGLTIHKNQIDLFRNALEKSASAQDGGEEDLSVDAEIDLQGVTFQLAREIGRLAPFGPSNPEPVFLVRHLRLNAFRKGRRFVQFKVRKEGGLTFDVSGPDYCFADSGLAVEGSEVDLAFSPRIGLWQGEERIFLTLKGIRAASGEGPATAPDCRDAE